MIWLSTQRAFPETIDGSTIDPLFLKSLIIIKSYADQTGRAMWSTVHSSFLIPSQFSGVKENGILLPLLPTLAGRIGLEARCALALGAKGLIYKDTCGTSDDYWYPLRTIGVNNRLGSLVQTLNSDLKSVDYAFIDTRVLNVGVLGAYDLENIIGKVTFPFGVLSSITGISGPLLVSRLCGYSKDYYVLVNLNVTTSQTLTVVFSDKVRTEDSLDYSYISKISGGDWKVFAYDLPLAKFGIKK